MKRLGVFFGLFSVACFAAGGGTVRIGVFGLFEPTEIEIRAAEGERVVLDVDGRELSLEGAAVARIRADSHEGLLIEVDEQRLRAPAVRTQSEAGFELSVPGRIGRSFHGRLEVFPSNHAVRPVAVISLEDAVATAVAAETSPDWPLEALKTQAVAARSYYTASTRRHEAFDFCDTTHCQLFQDPPQRSAAAIQASEATAGMALRHGADIVAGLFSRSCGGRTRAAAEVGLTDRGYPYVAVDCDTCRGDPVRWNRKFSRQTLTPLLAGGFTEPARLEIGRAHGWDALPSNSFAVSWDRDEASIEGTGEGHGVGLCQRGARGMAESGAGFREILAHYFPGVSLDAR